MSGQVAALSLMLAPGATLNQAPLRSGLVDSALLDVRADHGALEEEKELRHQLTLIGKPQLPDPRLIRRIIRQRQLRDRFFNNDLFADPVWDMLLDLAAATMEWRQVSIKSLCIASRVPPTTALRWINVMADEGLLRRTEDPLDRRRAFISLTDDGIRALAAYFAALGPDAQLLA